MGERGGPAQADKRGQSGGGKERNDTAGRGHPLPLLSALPGLSLRVASSCSLFPVPPARPPPSAAAPQSCLLPGSTFLPLHGHLSASPGSLTPRVPCPPGWLLSHLHAPCGSLSHTCALTLSLFFSLTLLLLGERIIEQAALPFILSWTKAGAAATRPPGSHFQGHHQGEMFVQGGVGLWDQEATPGWPWLLPCNLLTPSGSGWAFSGAGWFCPEAGRQLLSLPEGLKVHLRATILSFKVLIFLKTGTPWEGSRRSVPQPQGQCVPKWTLGLEKSPALPSVWPWPWGWG